MKRKQSDELGRMALQSAQLHHENEQQIGRVSRNDRKPVVWLPPHLIQELTDAEKFLIARNCSEGFSATKKNLLI